MKRKEVGTKKMLQQNNTGFDHRHLEGAIRAQGMTHQNLADKIGISRTSLEKKLRSKISFKDNEIIAIINTLGTDISMVELYFFTK